LALVLRLLRGAISQHASIHLARPETLVFLSDRQKGLIEGVDIVFPDNPHGYCLRHLYDNLHKKFKHKDLQPLLYKAAKSPTVQEFDVAILEMKKVDNDCVEWLLATADKNHWAEDCFPGRRYGHFTSNIAESINSFLLTARKLPVFSMMEFIRGELTQWFHERSAKGGAEHALVVKSVALDIEVSVQNQAHRYRYQRSTDAIWEVRSQTNIPDELRGSYIVNIDQHTCDCHRWQTSGVPCAHALAILLHLRKDPYLFVEPCFYSAAIKAHILYQFSNPRSNRMDATSHR